VNILRAMGCKVMQGYYFGKPMPGGEVLDFLGSDLGFVSKNAAVRAMAS
jgi:EAL domain-containing protein (putative c-di-GMP-specific phosphodiesterase class I)